MAKFSRMTLITPETGLQTAGNPGGAKNYTPGIPRRGLRPRRYPMHLSFSPPNLTAKCSYPLSKGELSVCSVWFLPPAK